MHRSPGRAAACARFPIMVRTLRGVEAIARAEVAAVLGPAAVTTEHRTLRFSVLCLDERLLDLGTVDDAFLVLGDVEGVDHRRSALEPLVQLARTIDAPGTVAALASLRPIGPPQPAAHVPGPRFSITSGTQPRASSHAIGFDLTASFIGRRNYSRFEVEDRVGHAIAAATGWAYRPRSPQVPVQAALSIRVHILHERATLAVRLGERPLHRRAYRLESRPGALHPPLARALCVVAEPAPGDVLVDPTCGVGTIAIEAALLEPRVVAAGFDLDRTAVRAARANAHRAGVDARFVAADASRLPIADRSVARIIINPPWGRSVVAGGRLRGRDSWLWAETSRVLGAGGRLVALLPTGRPAPAAEVVAHVRVRGAEAAIWSTRPG
jgi:tRNA (guanine6-N2)-methyltransferase